MAFSNEGAMVSEQEHLNGLLLLFPIPQLTHLAECYYLWLVLLAFF